MDPQPSMLIRVLKKFTTYLVVIITVIVCNNNRKVVRVIPVLTCFWCNILLNLSKYFDFIYFKDKS